MINWKQQVTSAMNDKGLVTTSKKFAAEIVKFFGELESKHKAFYTGTGYSGVHDPDYDMPEDTGEFHRTGFEKLKRYRTFIVDGNSVKVLERSDAGGDPVTRITDVMTFNVQDSLEAWLKKVGAKNISNDGKRVYSIEDLVSEDNTWVR